MDLAAQMPQTRLINVCDREADFFEMLEEHRRNPCVDLLVRANHNRGITDEPFKLFETIRQASLQTKVQIPIPRQSARPKLSKKKARAKRPSRQAELECAINGFNCVHPSIFPAKLPSTSGYFMRWKRRRPKV